MRYRMLALDLDGTLLDPEGALPADAAEAVAEARRRGLAVVLCTGRRLRSARPVAQALGLDGPAVLHNGVVVKDLRSGATLRQEYLPAACYAEVLALAGNAGSPLVYVDDATEKIDIVVDAHREVHPYQREYLVDNLDWILRVDDLGRHPSDAVIMVSLMGDPEALAALRRRAEAQLDGRVALRSLTNKNYRGQILEFVTPGSSKWRALRAVAEQAGIGPEAIAAVGDDRNDAEMIAGAGLGIAVGNAVPEVLAVADRTVPGNDAGGVVHAIELVLAGSA